MSNPTELSEDKRALLEKYLRRRSQTTAAADPISKSILGSPAPLSFGQQQMWLLAQLMPDIPLYSACVTLHLPGPLEVAAFEQSFNEFIKRHEAWRTSFPMVDGQAIQMVHPFSTLKLPLIDLRSLPEDQRESEALRLATGDVRTPFDLAQIPLLRPKLIQFGDAEHRLFLTLHHIIFDDTGLFQVFLPELHALYEAFSNSQPLSLSEPPIQYTDFAVWQRGRLEGQTLADHLAYWKQHLEGPLPTLALPTDRPRPSVSTYRGSIYSFSLPKRLADDLKALGRREGVTLFMTLAAAFQTLLHRYAAQDDILIGTAIADRKRPEVQRLMGYFLNTLVLRTNLSGDPAFRELLRRVREVTVSAYAHQDMPFEYLIKELRPERHLGQNPLFQVMLVLEPLQPALPSGWTITWMDVDTGTSKFDLSLILEDRPEGLMGRIEYSTDLFEEATIVRTVGHWQTLLEGIVANPEQHLSELPLLTPEERQQLLVEWNATQVLYPRDECMHQLFEAQAERTPEAMAVAFQGGQVTYRELNRRSNQLAHYLQRLGVGPEVMVGICVERSLDMVVGLLGILKAGGAYVPLDPAYPKERLTFLLQDTQISVLLTQERLLRTLPKHIERVVCLDAGWGVIAQENSENVISEVMADNLAYVIYTSGSTGRPKGVLVTHRNLVHSTIARTAYYKEPVNSFLLLSSFAFDSSVAGIFWTLCQGGLLVLPRAGFEVEISYLAELIARNRISHLLSLPSLYMLFLERDQAQHLSSLRTVIVAGESCPRELVDRHYGLLSETLLFNEYGPTEGTVWSSVYRCESQNPRSPVPIGRPIANTKIYLLDTHLQPMTIGVPGELYIGGAGVARGYLHRSELTAERFIDNPFGNECGACLYKTGDLARYLPDGNIEILGRVDHQVKIRGYRIELGEIETVLALHPAVREAIVVAREDAPGDKRLVAYVVLDKERPVMIDDLKSHLAKHVPPYMLPSAFVLLKRLPLTPNGKVDRGALPPPGPVRTAQEGTFIAPRLMVHYQLVQIWEELLEARPIGIRDDFFALGGHSLLAARLIHRIEQVCGTKLPLATLFARPTIEQLAAALLGEAEADSRTPLVAVQATGSKRPFFYLHGDWNGGAFYCFPLARALGPDQPFYALEPYKFDGLQAPPSFEDMAAAHLQALRAVQPEGPYLLGGVCTGGLVAYEMACQLRAQGQAVDLLVLIDADYPAPAWRRWVRAAISHLAGLLRADEAKQLDWFLYLRHIYRYVRFAHYRQMTDSERFSAGEEKKQGGNQDLAEPSPGSIVPRVEDLRQDWTGIYDWVALGYTPSLYPGKITFFRVSEEPWRFREWRRLTEAKKEVEVHAIPGTHITSRTEHLPVLAEHLHDCVNKAQMTTESKGELSTASSL